MSISDLPGGSPRKYKKSKRKYSYSLSWDQSLMSALGRKIKKTPFLKNVKQFSGFESRGLLR